MAGGAELVTSQFITKSTLISFISRSTSCRLRLIALYIVTPIYIVTRKCIYTLAYLIKSAY